MANDQNLVRYQQGEAKARENGRKGGLACGVARRAKRDARLAAQQVLNQHPDLAEKTLAAYQRYGMKKSYKPDVRYVATLAAAKKAMNGDVRAYEFLAKLAGENATDARGNPVVGPDAMPLDDQPVPAALDSDAVRQRMAQMTDEELAQYERMCALFEDAGGGTDE